MKMFKLILACAVTSLLPAAGRLIASAGPPCLTTANGLVAPAMAVSVTLATFLCGGIAFLCLLDLVNELH
jgi:hypothetical protein